MLLACLGHGGGGVACRFVENFTRSSASLIFFMLIDLSSLILHILLRKSIRHALLSA